MEQIRTWLRRLLALAALIGSGVAVYVAVGSVGGSDTTSAEEARAALARLNTVNETLSERLEALSPGGSAQEARDATRTALTTTQELVEQISAEDPVGVRVRSALGAELSYLDAVGSTLANPRSALAGTIATRAAALRAALRPLAVAEPRAVHGADKLLAYTRARIGE